MEKIKYTFIKWFISFASILTASIIAGTQGVFSLVVQSDISHISSVIAFLFVVCSLLAGKLAYDLSDPDDKDNWLLTTSEGRIRVKQRLNILRFMADAFFTLGLLGTIVGFCYMMKGTLNASNDVSVIITQLKVGSSTKLYTTLAGIVCSLLLQVQTLIITNDLVEDNDENN